MVVHARINAHSATVHEELEERGRLQADVDAAGHEVRRCVLDPAARGGVPTVCRRCRVQAYGDIQPETTARPGHVTAQRLTVSGATQRYRAREAGFHLEDRLRHPDELGESEVEAFLTYLAVEREVSASTQNQALSALLFLYRHGVSRHLGTLGEVVRARMPERLPVVMTSQEVRDVLAHMSGDTQLMARLM